MTPIGFVYLSLTVLYLLLGFMTLRYALRERLISTAWRFEQWHLLLIFAGVPPMAFTGGLMFAYLLSRTLVGAAT